MRACLFHSETNEARTHKLAAGFFAGIGPANRYAPRRVRGSLAVTREPPPVSGKDRGSHSYRHDPVSTRDPSLCAAGTRTAWKMYGPGPDQILMRYRASDASYLHYHPDQFGSVVMAAN